MNQTPDPLHSVAERLRQAETELARVQHKVAAARSLLVRLLQQVAVAERHLGRPPPAQLLEANEHLLVAALQHQDEAQASAAALQQVARSAGLDPLTQLPNRLLLLDRLAHALASAKRHRSRVALLFVDLDRFKPINDTLGHSLGDEVLKLVARRMVSAVREADTVSRYGGDEFLILLDEVAQPGDVETVARKLVDTIAAPVNLGGRALALSASVGISLYPDDGEGIEGLIGMADAAMYRAKRQGPGGYAFHGGDAPEAARRLSPAATLPPRLASHAEQERRNAELREANEQLVLAALTAQELRDAAQRARKP